MVKAKRIVTDDLRLLDPAAPEWRSVTQETMSLGPTPLLSQPSLYVQASWQDKPYGVVGELAAGAAHNDSNIYFRLQWRDDAKDDLINDTDAFADAAAILFPLRGGDAPLTNMGSPQEPVLAWYWRADFEEPLSITAQGVGSTVRRPDAELHAQSAFEQASGWTVVLSHRMRSHLSDTVHLMPGQAGKVAFAVWRGSNKERGGLKSVTLQWQSLEIEQ